MSRLALVLVVLVSGAVSAEPATTPAPADAAPTREAIARAKAADASARAHYDRHEYAAAIEDYHRAFAALPDPLFLFDLGQAYRQLHDCDEARAAYRDYLARRPDAQNRPTVEKFLAEMDACATQADAVTTQPGPAPEPPSPPPGPLPTPAAAAATATVTAPSQPSPPAPPADRATPSRTLRVAGIATAAGGVLLVGAGVASSISGANDASQLEAMCAQGCNGADVASLDRAGEDANRTAAITYAVGGVALAAGAAMLWWSLAHHHGEPAVVAPAPGGAVVSAGGVF